MGNSNSAPRGHAGEGPFQEIANEHMLPQNGPDRQLPADPTAARRRTQPLRAVSRRASTLYRNFRRQPSIESLRQSQNAQERMTSQPDPQDESTHDTSDEHEDRPLVVPPDAEMQDSPMPEPDVALVSRRRSTMSRLGSRFLPDSVARGLIDSGEEMSDEGRALRNGQERMSSVFDRSINLSYRSSIRRRADQRPDPRRRPIRGPFPLLQNSHQLLDPDSPRASSFDGMRDTPSPTVSPPRQRNRFSRVRDSLSLPSRLSSLFVQSSDTLQAAHSARESPIRPPRVTFADESDHLLPSQPPADQRHESDDAPHELDAVEPEARNLLSSPRVTSGMSTIRRFQPGLRSRSTRLIRRGEHPPLSQVLQLAAAAIAAQLSGHNAGGPAAGRRGGMDAFDGNIQNFVQTLQEAATAQAGEGVDVNAADGELPPVNFMRVFQFPNDENGDPITSQAQSRDVDRMDIDSIAGPTGTDRSVTLVLVGVRSLPHGQDGQNGENGTLGPSLDTLLSLPFLPPANVLRNGSSGALFRRSDARTRSNSRRHSMTNFSFPAQYETQRHHRSRSAAVSESPAGPVPPPSTPADMRSGQSSPARRPSSASAAQSSNLPDLQESHPEDQEEISSSEPSSSTARHRRRSDSEFARRPELGSGAARRNGMVEPDHIPQGRSWLIYVVGTNVSPDHPAFTMPSLFTDNPSYEDMQMLSTLLGPVKPPVATQEDVRSAGGLFRLVVREHYLIGEPIAGGETSSIAINSGDRCLICLSDYEEAEEIRRLDKCEHMYHRECIDEWLTTGRNSCPMCRGQGVREKQHIPAAQAGETAPPSV